MYTAPDGVPPHLTLLVNGLEQSLSRRRFTFDQREHKPHITLLRNARAPKPEFPVLPPVRWRVNDFALMQSVPQGGLMSYRVLSRFPLLAAGYT